MFSTFFNGFLEAYKFLNNVHHKNLWRYNSNIYIKQNKNKDETDIPRRL